jgi:hypothetical protein
LGTEKEQDYLRVELFQKSFFIPSGSGSAGRLFARLSPRTKEGKKKQSVGIYTIAPSHIRAGNRSHFNSLQHYTRPAPAAIHASQATTAADQNRRPLQAVKLHVNLN